MTEGLAQIQVSRMSLIQNYHDLVTEEMASPRALDPKGLLLAGDIADLSQSQRRGFELWRNAQREIDVITFDEMRRKVELMVELLKKAAEV